MSDNTVVGSLSYASSQTSLVDDDTTVILRGEDKDSVSVSRSSVDAWVTDH
jgi:hypothetical protein